MFYYVLFFLFHYIYFFIVEFYFVNGDIYEGDFVNDVFHGFGTLHYANGTEYSGEFKEGEKNGTGTYILSNGDKYEGGFVDGVFEGEGGKNFHFTLFQFPKKIFYCSVFFQYWRRNKRIIPKW